MRRTDTHVDTFLEGLEGERSDDIRTLDTPIRRRMPDAGRFLYEGTFWGGSDQQIVGYGVIDHRNGSGDDVEWFMDLNAVEDGQYLLRRYEGKLGKAKLGSASIAFSSIDDVDLENLMELVSLAAGQLS